MIVKFKQWNCIAMGGRYANGRKALSLIDAKEHDPVATASVNIPEERIKKDQIFIKDYSENEGMAKALIDAGIIYKEPILSVKSGFVVIRAYNLSHIAIERIWP
jgi:hypothetical protein